jgi:hypothetical protein
MGIGACGVGQLKALRSITSFLWFTAVAMTYRTCNRYVFRVTRGSVQKPLIFDHRRVLLCSWGCLMIYDWDTTIALKWLDIFPRRMQAAIRKAVR